MFFTAGIVKPESVVERKKKKEYICKKTKKNVKKKEKRKKKQKKRLYIFNNNKKSELLSGRLLSLSLSNFTEVYTCINLQVDCILILLTRDQTIGILPVLKSSSGFSISRTRVGEEIAWFNAVN